MSFNYFVKPGVILKSYLDEREISQKELALITESSERHISQVINGKARISEELALKLERVFQDIKAEYWLELEMKYQLFLLRNKDVVINDNEKIIEEYKLDYIFKGLGYSKDEKVIELLNIVGEKSVVDLNNAVTNMDNHLFFHEHGNEKTMYLWLKLCEEKIHIDNDFIDKEFNHKEFKRTFPLIKRLLNTKDYKHSFNQIRRFLNNNGVGLVIEEAIPTSKIRGATTVYDDHPVIYLSKRYKRLDSIYFSLVHEIYHIVNGDYLNREYEVSYENDERELLSNENTREFFIGENEYKDFVSKGEFSEESIQIFASETKVIVDFVIGFLQKDGFIKYSDFNHLRTYVKEGDDY